MGQRGSRGADPAYVVIATAGADARHDAPRSPAPLASVIIATYNWSAALAYAIRSVLRQTLQDFEILVIGDACTDDSASVVATFGDPRIVFVNLDANTGSQHGPNNAGLARARGEWIAYLGHDDIWAPRHLEATIAAARAAHAGVAAGGMIMYGPPGSGTTYTAGLFDDAGCADSDFVPPSALVHRRDLVARTGAWADPRTLRLPTDCDFFQRLRAASPVAASNEVTVFKFNAALRRNAYQAKSTGEQAACLANLADGDRFVARELVKVLAARIAGRSATITMPDVGGCAAGEIFHANRVAKGVAPRYASDALCTLDAARRYTLEREPASFEWHAPEHDHNFGLLRWTGPASRATIELPVRLAAPLAMRIHIAYALQPAMLDALTIDAQGAPVDVRIARTPIGTWEVSGVIDPARHASHAPYVQVTLCNLDAARPVDLGIGTDTRRLGLAVGWIELAPIDKTAPA